MDGEGHPARATRGAGARRCCPGSPAALRPQRPWGTLPFRNGSPSCTAPPPPPVRRPVAAD